MSLVTILVAQELATTLHWVSLSAARQLDKSWGMGTHHGSSEGGIRPVTPTGRIEVCQTGEKV